MEPKRITTWSLMRKQNSRQLSPTIPNTPEQNMIYAAFPIRNVMMTTDHKFQDFLDMVPGTTTYTKRVFWKCVLERIRSN